MPLAAVALGVMAVGTGLQIAGNAKAQSAMNAVRAASTAQQKKLQGESDAVYQKSLKQSTRQKAAEQMAEGEAQRVNAWEALQKSTVPAASALPATTPKTTSQAATRAAAGGNAWNTLTAKAAARQGSYADWEQQQANKNTEANQKVSMLNNFSQGDAALLPVEMQVASQAGDKLSGWGQIVQTLGSVAFAANSAGLFKGAASLPASAGSTALAAGEVPAIGNATEQAAGIGQWTQSQMPNWNSIY